MSIVNEINRIKNNIANAYTKAGEKGASLPANKNSENLASTIETITGGAPSTGIDWDYDTFFYDYDGTVLHHYTHDELQALTELPPLPQHEGLIAQEWSWSLADLKKEPYGIDVGCYFITDDGSTRIYFELEHDNQYVVLGFNGGGTLSINWGDGTIGSTKTHTYVSKGEYMITISGTSSISITAQNYCSLFIGGGSTTNVSGHFSNTVLNKVKKIEFGNITSISMAGMAELKTYTIPVSATATNYMYRTCGNLKYALLPKSSITTANIFDGLTGVENIAYSKNVLPTTYNSTSLSKVSRLPEHSYMSYSGFGANLVYNNKRTKFNPKNGCVRVYKNYLIEEIYAPGTYENTLEYSFSDCSNLKKIRLSDSLKKIKSYSFANCYALEDVNIPSELDEIGSYAFQSCNNLKTLPEKIVGKVPQISQFAFSSCYKMKKMDLSETEIVSIDSNAFANCRELEEINLPLSLTNIGSNAFASCYALKEVALHEGITTLGASAFAQCFSLKEIVLPDSLTNIPQQAFSYCHAIKKVVFGANTTAINASAFQNCTDAELYDFRKATVIPSLYSISSLYVSSGTVIVVPDNLYDNWITTSTWSTSTVRNKIIKASDYVES